jgi:hypothetical protein
MITVKYQNMPKKQTQVKDCEAAPDSMIKKCSENMGSNPKISKFEYCINFILSHSNFLYI